MAKSNSAFQVLFNHCCRLLLFIVATQNDKRHHDLDKSCSLDVAELTAATELVVNNINASDAETAEIRVREVNRSADERRERADARRAEGLSFVTIFTTNSAQEIYVQNTSKRQWA